MRGEHVHNESNCDRRGRGTDARVNTDGFRPTQSADRFVGATSNQRRERTSFDFDSDNVCLEVHTL